MTVRGSPSISLRPKLMATMRSTTDSRACTMCSIHTIETPAARSRRMVATSWCTSASVRPPAISSSSSTRGPVASALASSSRFSSSSGRVPARRLALPASSTASIAARLAWWGSPSPRTPPGAPEGGADQHVLVDGHADERAGDLVGEGHAELAAGARGQVGDVPTLQAHPPGVGAELPRRKLQHGRLAGPVGADHAERLAGVEPHAQVVDDLERPIRLGDTLQLQERRHVSSSLPADHGTGALGGPPEGSGEPQGGAPVDRGELAPPTWNGDRLWSRCQPRSTVLRVGDRL